MKIVLKPRDFFKQNYIKGTKIDVTQTAKELKVSRKSIYNWMDEINKAI